MSARVAQVWQAIWVGMMCAAMCVTPMSAQEVGYWRADSNTAKSITGDISFGTQKVAINLMLFTIAEIRDLKPAEVSSVFDVDVNAAAAGKLYRTAIPGGKVFLHKNTLCGGEDVQWIAVDVIGKELHVAMFSSAQPPVFEREAIMNSTNLCGTFTYAR